jgi:hypothetical protein
MLLLAVRARFAAPATPDEKERDRRCCAGSTKRPKTFRSTSADFEFDSIETDPIYDKDVQKGTVYYERKGAAFQMAAHITEDNGKPAPKVYTYSGGVFLRPSANSIGKHSSV